MLNANQHLYAEGTDQHIKASLSQENSTDIGAAADIGTTTVALSVYELSSGKCLASETALNPQSTVAADVIGRIDVAMHGHLEELQSGIINCIKELAKSTGYLDHISQWVITGNTTMLYLLTGRTPKALSASPFEADCLFGMETDFLGKPLYLPDCMHAFVGAGISCGCQSVQGAIECVTLNDGTLNIQTIGNAPAAGLCGSGIIDAVACFLDSGAVEETGAMEEEQISLCEGITVNRQDIRAIQLAKAAIAGGIQTLLQLTDTSAEDITTLYLAGGFGSHLNIDSAVRIGLLPEALRNKVKVIGNAALKGAASFLTEPELKEKAHIITADAVCINLGGMAEFNNNYIEEMLFSEPKLSRELLKMANKLGFSHFGIFPAQVLSFRQEVRDMCKADRCSSYGTRWTCPPYCGTLEESVEKAKKFNSGILLQMTGIMEDDFDVECIQNTEQMVKNNLALFIKELRQKNIPCLPMTVGTCTICAKCTCPDEPCCFPEEAFTSMEAYGLVVSDVCTAAGLNYNYGQKP